MAGIGVGQSVLDIGSGVGDVALLLARIVGSAGEVVGVERDPRSLARASARTTEAGLSNIRFIQSDVSQIPSIKSFDAAVGRFVLMYMPAPAETLRAISRLVRPGGAVVFQEPSFVPVRALWGRLPLWSAAVDLLVEAFRQSGANPEIGTELHEVFQRAGLPAPELHMDIPIGYAKEADFSEGICDLLASLKPQIEQFGLNVDAIGDFGTLPGRLQAELVQSNAAGPRIGAVVAAWSRRLAENPAP
jgi:SAM-dependent methyltransferase